jgi:hypothetical protein
MPGNNEQIIEGVPTMSKNNRLSLTVSNEVFSPQKGLRPMTEYLTGFDLATANRWPSGEF